MLPIIFGLGPRTTELESGTFTCPNCSGPQRSYIRKKVRNYFRLYFIPLVPLGAGQEFIECQFCHRAWEPGVLDANVKAKREIRPLAEQLNKLRRHLEDEGYPVEYAVADLTAAGLDRDVALENVRRAIGDTRGTCPTCGLTYAETVARCAEDNTPLT